MAVHFNSSYQMANKFSAGIAGV